MPASVSYRLDEHLKQRVAARAAQEGISETALVSRLLDEGLKTIEQPGIVYRGGPTGRRAATAGGPDVWEIIVAVRHAPGEGDTKIEGAAEQMGVPARLVRLAVGFASAHPEEIEQRITANEEAVERARRLAEQRERLLAS
jgi:hypothetical protein